MYQFKSLLTGETYDCTFSPAQLLRDVMHYTHESWKLYYLGKNVFAVVNPWSIKFHRVYCTSSGALFAVDVVVQLEVALLIKKFLKGGE